MPIGSIQQAIKLISDNINPKSSYSYYFAETMPDHHEGRSISYSVSEEYPGSYEFDSSDYQNNILTLEYPFGRAFTAIDGVSGVSFSYLNNESADIVISYLDVNLWRHHAGGASPIAGFATQPRNSYGEIASDIWILPDGATDAINLQRTSQHELLHSIGLLDVTPLSGSPIYSGFENSGRYTIMSYENHPGESRAVTELQLYDIAALQALYGRDDTSNAGDTVYSTFTEVVDGNVVDRMFSIWDGDGWDTINAASVAQAALIDLRPGYFSSIGPDSRVQITGGSNPGIAVDGEGALNISIAFGAYIENAVGTGSNDLLIGNLLSNTLEGGAGDDVIYAEGAASIYGAGDGTYDRVTSLDPSKIAAAPDDVKAFVDDPSRQRDHLLGGLGNDYLHGGRGHDLIEGGADDDIIIGGNGYDELRGDGGNDTLDGGEDDDTLTGGAGDDALDGGEGSDTLDGGDGEDTLIGGAEDDTIVGGEGDDTFWGGDEDDDQGAADGLDTADYSAGSAAITITFDADTEALSIQDGTGGTDTLHSIERVIGTARYDYVSISGYIDADLDLEIDGGGGQADNSADVINGRGISAAGLEVWIGSFGNGYIGNRDGAGGRIQLKNFHTQIVASEYGDQITDYSDGHKRIDGGAGNDVISTSETSSDVIIYGGDGDDQIHGGAGDDILFGGSSMLSPSNDSDDVYGLGGNDLIVINGTGFSHAYGGDGDDHIQFIFSGSVAESGQDNADGGSGNDYIELLGQYDYGHGFLITGGEGNDVVNALNATGGEFRFTAGDGHDAIYLGAQTVGVVEEEEDSGEGPSLSVRLYGIAEDDVTLIVDFNPDENYQYYAAEMVLLVESTGDSIYLSEHRFYWSHFNGIVDLYSLSLTGDGWATGLDIDDSDVEVVFGSVDAYRIEPTGSYGPTPPDPEETSGTSGDDYTRGGRGNDDISGGDGDDTIESSGGDDIIDGGRGTDTLSVFGSLANFSVATSGNSIILTDETGLQGVMTLTSVERVFFVSDGQTYWTGELVGSAGTSGDDVIDGDAFDNEIYGLGGNDTLSGLAGDDNLVGGEGNDTLLGGAGNDSHLGGEGIDTMVGGDGDDHYQVDNLGDVVIEVANEGYDVVDASIDYVLGANLEGLFLRGAATAGTGNSLDNMLYGGRNNDTLDGGAGSDEMAGGAGDDLYLVDHAGDLVIEDEDEGFDFVQASVSYVLGANVEGLELLGEVATDGTGNELDNELYGNGLANTLSGLDGSDWIDGSEGADIMIGGDGDDSYFVDDAGDVVIEDADEGYDFVYSSINYVLGANVESLYLWNETTAINGTGNELDNELYGDDHTNTLSGLDSDDVLDGADGDDILIGGDGSDTLIGGAGNDTFRFDAAQGSSNVDTIDDFEPGGDIIELDSNIFAGLPTGVLAAGALVIGSAAVDADDRIIYDDVTGELFYDADGLGGAEAVQFASLSSGLALTATDFIIV